MTSLTRWYIDTRHLTQTTEDLPLIETLRENDQKAVKKYLRLPDRHMSLASNLLKYLYIHRSCRIPWSEVIVSRTPKPHQRPCFIPSSPNQTVILADGSKGAIPAIEFNVSHQASFVALGGCILPPSSPSSSSPSLSDTTTAATVVDPSSAPIPSIPQIGIDITCVDEPGRRRDRLPKTIRDVTEFIDIFKDVFSQRELDTMKRAATAATTAAPSLEATIQSTLRLFYAYWALKEAYIKMTGEALLAPWLRELEFTDVVAPVPVSTSTSTGGDAGSWGEPYTGVKTWLYGKRVEDVRVELVAFETDYLVATAARGANLGSVASVHADSAAWCGLERIDIERDVRPCATEDCQCLG